MDLALVLSFVTGVLSGLVAALTVIAPKTKSTLDDKILEYAEKALEVLPDPKAKAAVEVAKESR